MDGYNVEPDHGMHTSEFGVRELLCEKTCLTIAWEPEQEGVLEVPERIHIDGSPRIS
jgi:hypothetical protein